MNQRRNRSRRLGLLALRWSPVAWTAEQELSGSLGLRGGGEMQRRDFGGSTKSLDAGGVT